MKKIGILLGTLLILFVAAALIVPLVVDVDKYRPQILTAANQQLNGKLELGKLSLSLWGQIKVEVAGLKLTDSHGQEVVGVKNAFFHLPFLPLLTGSPVVTFKMDQPLVKVVKYKSGKMNVMGLVNEAPRQSQSQAQAQSQKTAPPAQTPQTAPAKGGESSQSLPAIATRARLGVELRSALITYVDELSGLNSQVRDLNLILRDISLSHPTELEIWADLDTQLGQVEKTFILKGPARLTGKAQPQLKDGKVDHVSLTAKLDMDGVEMKAPGLFEKKKGIATNVELAVTASESEAKIEKFVARFFNAEVNALGTVTHLTSSAPPSGSSSAASSPVVHLTVKSNSIEFKPWVELVPLLKEYELGGAALFEAEANGPSQKLGYSAKLSFNDITAKAPKLKAQPKLDGLIHVVTDQVDTISVTMKAPANDLKIRGKLVSFTQPKLDMTVTSTGMDLDQLIEFPPPAPKAKANPPATGGGANEKSAQKAAPATDLDALLAPLRENKMLLGFVARIGIDMKMIKAYQVKMSDITCQLTFKDLAAGMDQCGFKVFSGAIQSDFHLQMKPKTPTYQFNAKVNGLDIGQAVESQMSLFKNTVLGKAGFSMTGQGASFNPDPAISNLNAHGNLKVDQAEFATIDVTKMVSEAVTKAMNQIGDKVPAAKGKSLGAMPSKGSKYEFISSDFTISGGKFVAPNFYAKSLPNQGIDIKGRTAVGIKDYSLDTAWDVIDTYNLTHLKDVSVDQNGVRVEHIFAEGNSPVHFPMHAACTIMAPCYSSTEVPEALAKVALSNISHAVAGKAKEELKKQAESVIKQAPPAIQDKLKKFF